jgi:hypothetical protein
MNKKIKNNIVNNFFKLLPSESNFIRVVFVLFIVAVLIIILYLLYRVISNAVYISKLKTDFYKLQDMGLNVKNYNLIYYKEVKKKYIPKMFKILNEKKHGEFMNKKMIGFIPDKYIVLDIDIKDNVKNGIFLIDKIPKDTAFEKTPNGYHYYFENDTGNTIYTYIKMEINGEEHSVDILGVDCLVTMSPSCIDGKSYYWINSIFTHKPAKLSENTWILDLIKNKKAFISKFDGFNLDISIKNVFIIIDNLHIETYFRLFLQYTKTYSKKIKLLHGTIYIYDGNYYFMTRSSFNKYKNKKKMLYEISETISKLNILCIIDLSIIYSNYLTPGSIFQITACSISDNFKNYKYDNFFPNYIETDNIYKKTNYILNDMITICNYDNTKLKNEMYNVTKNNKINKILIGPESIYVTILLSNYYNIPCICNALTYSPYSNDAYSNDAYSNDAYSITNNNYDINKISKEYTKKIMNNFISIF